MSALQEMARVVRIEGEVAVLDPSERMNMAAADILAERRGLRGLDCDSLLNWATIAEANRRGRERDLHGLFAATKLRLAETTFKVGSGLARFAKGARA